VEGSTKTFTKGIFFGWTGYGGIPYVQRPTAINKHSFHFNDNVFEVNLSHSILLTLKDFGGG